MKMRKSTWIIICLVIGITVFITGNPERVIAAPFASAKNAPAIELATVVRVVDGDTFVVNIGGFEESVRLIGVDTPETVHPRKPVQCYGPEASKYLKERLLPSTQVFLGYEKKRTGIYGRKLAYVFLPWSQITDSDGSVKVGIKLINLEIISKGLGRTYTRFPFRYLDLFIETENLAKEAGRGLWTACLDFKEN